MKEYHREVRPAPEKMVEEGRFNFGTFNSPFRIVNPLEAKKPLGLPLPGFIKDLRLKEWQAFQLGDQDNFMLAVVYNAKGIALSQFIHVNKKEQKMIRYEKMFPFWKAHIAQSLWDTHSYYQDRDFLVDIHNDLANKIVNIKIRINNYKDLPDVEANFTGHHDQRVTPIVICQPFAENRALYSHKALAPMEGKVDFGGNSLVFDQESAFMVMDDHKGYYPFTMAYDWTTSGGYHPERGLIGFNLTDNQVQDHERYNENCLWIDGDMHPLPPVKFDRPNGVEKDWFIRDAYGQVDIRFTPVFESNVHINAVLIKTEYYGPYGQVNGCILDKNGERVSFDGFFGMGEKKYIRA